MFIEEQNHGRHLLNLIKQNIFIFFIDNLFLLLVILLSNLRRFIYFI